LAAPAVGLTAPVALIGAGVAKGRAEGAGLRADDRAEKLEVLEKLEKLEKLEEDRNPPDRPPPLAIASSTGARRSPASRTMNPPHPNRSPMMVTLVWIRLPHCGML
jgi:hypothetical protein